jgi:hypothetical protein
MARKRNIRVRPRYRDEPDVKKLSRALLALAQAEAERAAQAEHEQQQAPADKKAAS